MGEISFRYVRIVQAGVTKVRFAKLCIGKVRVARIASTKMSDNRSYVNHIRLNARTRLSPIPSIFVLAFVAVAVEKVSGLTWPQRPLRQLGPTPPSNLPCAGGLLSLRHQEAA